jgi:hypothetical protein
MARGRSRSTGMYLQQELRAKLKRLEEEIARTRAAAENALRRGEREQTPASETGERTAERPEGKGRA